MNLGPLEVIVIFIVALLVFGPNKLPEMGRQVGKAVREFRKFQSSFNNEFRDFIDEPSAPAQKAQTPSTPGAGSQAAESASTSNPSPTGPSPAPTSGPAVPLRPAGGDEERGSGNGDGSAGPATQA